MNAPAAPVIYSGPAGNLTANAAGFLRVGWSRAPRTLAATQALFEAILLQLQLRGWQCLLIDQTQMPAFDGVEQAWIATDWLPRAVQEGGYRFGAVLVSPAVLVRLATIFITTHVQGLPLVYRSFDTEAAATDWLGQQIS